MPTYIIKSLQIHTGTFITNAKQYLWYILPGLYDFISQIIGLLRIYETCKRIYFVLGFLALMSVSCTPPFVFTYQPEIYHFNIISVMSWYTYIIASLKLSNRLINAKFRVCCVCIRFHFYTLSTHIAFRELSGALYT